MAQPSPAQLCLEALFITPAALHTDTTLLWFARHNSKEIWADIFAFLGITINDNTKSLEIFAFLGITTNYNIKSLEEKTFFYRVARARLRALKLKTNQPTVWAGLRTYLIVLDLGYV